MTGNSARGIASEPHVSDSAEQRAAEPLMLQRLGDRLGRTLMPASITSKDGATVRIDGVSPDRDVLAECWAHQGPAKPAQQKKLVVDAVKLHWIAGELPKRPERLILCVSDPAAVRHLQGRSWQRSAIASLGVDVEVVELPTAVIQRLTTAQRRQYR